MTIHISFWCSSHGPITGKLAVEARFDALLVHIAEDVGRECDDGEVRELLLTLPSADVFARLISIFVRHVQVAQDDGIVTVRLRKDLVCTLDAVRDGLGFDGDL